MGKKIAQNEPIILSGRVYLAGFLAEEVSGYDLPAVLRVGDIKLHNVAKGGSRQRYGEKVIFSGFFAAGVWNGKRFCRLLMRKKAAVDATYVGIVELRNKARACAIDLKRLIAREAVWVAADHGYEVSHNAASHALAHNQAQVAKVVAPVVQPAAIPTNSTVSTVIPPAAANSTAASNQKPGDQLALFPDLPVTVKKKKVVKSRRRR